MAERQIDPSRLQGEALQRWYLRSPHDLEQERQAAAAQRHDDFFRGTSSADIDPGISRRPASPIHDVDPGIRLDPGTSRIDIDTGISWVPAGANRWRKQQAAAATQLTPLSRLSGAGATGVAAQSQPLTGGFRSPLDMAQDALHDFQSGPKIPRPNLAESFIPIVGPAWEAAGDLQDRNYGGAAFNAAMAVGDALPAGAIFKGTKALSRGIGIWKDGAVTAGAAAKKSPGRRIGQQRRRDSPHRPTRWPRPVRRRLEKPLCVPQNAASGHSSAIARELAGPAAVESRHARLAR